MKTKKNNKKKKFNIYDSEYSYRERKQIITSDYYKPYAKKYDYRDKVNKGSFLSQFLDDSTFLRLYKKNKKKYDYRDKANKDSFLSQFLDDNTFLRLYKKMDKNLKDEIRKYRKRNQLESVYNKVKVNYSI